MPKRISQVSAYDKYLLPKLRYDVLSTTSTKELNMIKLNSELKRIREEYENDFTRFKGGSNKGRCHEVARDIVRLFNKYNIPVEVHSFYVSKPYYSWHVIAYGLGKYYDFTGKQYGTKELIFNKNNIPNNYTFKGIMAITFFR